MQATLTVTPGEVLQINVGGAGGPGGTTVGGTAGWNGGGIGGGWSGGRSGGGASDVRQGGAALANRVLVGAGGGGTGVNYSTGNAGGNGGGLTGANGLTGTYLGAGATQSAGGAPNGALGIGGNAPGGQTGGGGGGGYYGGGSSAWEGGGGGSSYATSSGSSGITHTAGFKTGNGQVTLTWTGTACTSSIRVPLTVTVGGLPAATNVTATPGMICPGGSSDLTAASSGSMINWYTVPSGGVAIGSSMSGANFAVSPTSTTTYYAESSNPGSGSQSFSYTGAAQSFTVPSGVTSITFDIQGAQGGGGYSAPLAIPGLGGRVQGMITTTPGEVLQINVGGAGGAGGTTIGGTAGWNGGGAGGGWSGGRSGGGGGGASDIRRGGTALLNRIIVASGGGGTGVNYSTGDAGGNGGGLTGANGLTGSYLGGGATQSAGGAPNGALGIGGPGGSVNTGGGGGGGYYGGGGSLWEGGGGGSSYCTTVGASSVVHTAGYKTGNGTVILSWTGNGCIATTRTPVTVTIDNIAPTAICQPDTVDLDTLGNGSLIAGELDGGSTDNCSVASLSISQTSFTCANAGLTTVILTVTDGNGNTSTCATIVTVMGQPITSTLVADTTTCGYNVSCNGGSDGVAHANGIGGCNNYTYLWSNGATTATASGLGAGTHTVTVTDAGGATSVQTVTLGEPAALQVAATTTPSCAGDSTGSATVTASGGNDCLAYTYLWSNGATTASVSGLSAGTHNVTVTDGSGCTTIQTVTVAALPTPNPTITSSGNTLTAGQTWVTYQWLLNGSNISGANANSFTATTTGSYSLMVTDSNGCSGVSDTTNITIVGIANQMRDWTGISIYPNPARSEFRLRTESPIGYAITVNITDMFGRKLYSEGLPELGHEVAFDLKAFAAGTYMVEVFSEMGQRRVFRLVVE